MATTYEPIATYTIPSAQASYTFSSIPSTYTDLVLIGSGNGTTEQSYALQFNSDTGSNYSFTYLYGDGGSSISGRASNQTSLGAVGRQGSGSVFGTTLAHIQNYANTTTYKTALARGGSNILTISIVGLWRSTSAINSIKIFPEGSGNINAGSTFTLYGIKAA